MRTQGRLSFIGVCLVWVGLLAVCDTAAARPPMRGPVFRPGPPAHAPAYGYRRKQVCGHELVFDAGLGVYVVVGMTDWYYHEGHFYRVRGAVWEISLRGNLWEPVGIDKLPSGLQIKAKSLAKLNGNGNSVAKRNGNAGNPNGNPQGNANKPNAGPDANASKPKSGADANAGKVSGGADANAGKVSGSADANAGKLNSNPDGNAKAGSNAGKTNSNPDSGGKAKSAAKGKKK